MCFTFSLFKLSMRIDPVHPKIPVSDCDPVQWHVVTVEYQLFSTSRQLASVLSNPGGVVSSRETRGNPRTSQCSERFVPTGTTVSLPVAILPVALIVKFTTGWSTVRREYRVQREYRVRKIAYKQLPSSTRSFQDSRLPHRHSRRTPHCHDWGSLSQQLRDLSHSTPTASCRRPPSRRNGTTE